MKSFFFQVLYCGYKSFGWWIFTKARNPHGRNENSNTIYSCDPAHGSDAGAGTHSTRRQTERTPISHISITWTNIMWPALTRMSRRTPPSSMVGERSGPSSLTHHAAGSRPLVLSLAQIDAATNVWGQTSLSTTLRPSPAAAAAFHEIIVSSPVVKWLLCKNKIYVF